MKTAHTPAPWHYKLSGNVVDNRGARVATASEMPGQDEMQRLANARLISAAPELLATLESMVALYEAMHARNPYLDSRPLAALAAIAKAKGD